MRQSIFAASALLAIALAAMQPGPVTAQSSAFSPRVLVNGSSITHYEYEQRLRFMRLLNAPGDLVKESETTLIDDRLRLAEAKRMKIVVSPEQIRQGMEEFSMRFEMPLEEFIKIIEANGVAAETYRDFVHAGMAWREVVRATFGPTALAGIYEPEVDRALSTLTQKSAARVLLSEILLPTSKRVLATELATSLRGEASFAAAARQHSIAETAADGGRSGWRSVAGLPEAVLRAIGNLQDGQVSAPVRLADGRYAIYLMRDSETIERLAARNIAVDHARLVFGGAGTPAAAAELAKIHADVQTCMDLNEFSGELTRQTVLQSELGGDTAARLAALDENEYATYVSGGNQVVLMLCSRRVDSTTEADRDTIRGRLAEGRVSENAELYLQRLRSNAFIRKP